jgi:hypothetical protein
MTKRNEKLVEFPRQSARDILTDVLRDGAQQMLATAIEAEVDDYLAGRATTVDAVGRRYVVRNGHLPQRRFKRRSGTCRCSSRGSGTVGPPTSRRRSGRRSCPRISGRRAVWRPCIRGSISDAAAPQPSRAGRRG